MRALRAWLLRFAGLLHKERRDRELAEEIESHLQMHIEDNVRAGMTPTEARRQALLRFGGVESAKESCRDRRGIPLLETLWQDVRFGFRMLRKSPAFTAIAVLTLTLGIGANTSIFSIVNGVLLRPLVYPRPEQLMYLDTQFPALGFPHFPTSVPEYLELQRFNRSFADVGAFRRGEANLVADDRALRVCSAIVDAHLLKTLGVQLAQGRLFANEETGLIGRAPPVAVISYELWHSAFGERPIVGHSVAVDGQWHQIVGVMASGVDLMDNHTEIWLPLGFTDDERQARNNHNLYLIGRLKDGLTQAAAQIELNALIESWAARAGITPGLGHAGHVFLPRAKGGDGHILQMTPLADQIVGRAGRAIWMLQAAVGLVLVIACANIANLLLARAETRRREFAVLAALGAGRGRLIRKTMTESVILSVTGGALGVVLARAGVEALVRTYPTSLPRIGEVTVDQRVVLVSFAVAVACALLFGLAPMMHLHSRTAAENLKSGPRGSTGTSRHQVGRALVMVEIALAVIVFVGTGLLLRTVRNLTVVDAGFDRSHLLTFSIALPPTSFGLMGRARAYQSLLEQLRAVPGVRGATAMTGLPFDSPLSAYQTEIANNAATSGPLIMSINYYQRVMSGYFETMGIPILQGRGFQPTDATSGGRVVVVNETLANSYWKGQNPIGQQLRPAGTKPWFTVIGVAKDVKQSGVDQGVGTEADVLVDQLATDSPTTWVAVSPTTMNVVVRTTLPLATLAPTIARVVRNVDPSVPVTRLREMDEVFTESIRRSRLLAQLLSAFSMLALLLAAIGTYGVLAYAVAERRREIGIRLALGAEPRKVLGMVLAEGLRLTLVGVVIGALAALAVTRLLSTMIYGVSATDPVTFAAVAVLLVLVALAACYIPARRATRVDPVVALRYE